MTVLYPDELLHATGLAAQEITTGLAVVLYQQEKLTIEQAADLAGMDRFGFQHLLASRDLYLTLDVDDLEQDIATLRKLGRL